MSALAEPPRRPAPRSLSDVRDPDGPNYPVHLLEGLRTALVLFCAAFHGRQDAAPIADAGLAATCVDVDSERLGEMAAVYPVGWEFVTADAFSYAAGAAGSKRWDVVSLDPFSNLFERTAGVLDLWALLARHVLIIGAARAQEIAPPMGWELEGRYWRSQFGGGVDWVALRRA